MLVQFLTSKLICAIILAALFPSSFVNKVMKNPLIYYDNFNPIVYINITSDPTSFYIVPSRPLNSGLLLPLYAINALRNDLINDLSWKYQT